MTDSPSAQHDTAAIEQVEASVQRNLVRCEARARLSAIVSPVAVVVALLALWEAATYALGVPLFLLPAPSAIVLSMKTNASLLLFNGWITTVEIVLGFLLSIVVGIPLALAIFFWPPFSRSILLLL